MKFKIKKELLLDALNKVSKAISTKNLIPVLAGIKFELKKKKLVLTATDNDITIQYYIDKKRIASIEETGCSVIYGKSLLDIIRRLPDSNILIENYETNEVSFKTDNSNYNFNCFSEEDFPNINLDEIKTPIILDSTKFKEVINKTSFACSMQESRPLLTGVNIKIQGDLFECTAIIV